MKTTLIAAALTLSTLALAPSVAHACGPYGPPDPAMEARMDVFAAIHQHGVSRWVSDVEVKLSDSRRGVATIRYKNGRELTVGLLAYQDRWVVVRRPVARASRAIARR